MKYIYIQNDKIIGAGGCTVKNEDIYNAEVSEKLYTDYLNTPDKYIVETKEIEIDVPDFETVEEEYETFALDENGEPVYDIEKQEYQVEVLDEEGNPVLDEDGNPTNTTEVEEIQIPRYETRTREVEKQVGSHKETITVPYPVINPNYEEEEAERERQRLDMLSLTKREVFLALYKAKGITPEMVRGSITDDEALIEFDYAERFYRGNPLIDKIGIMLGYSIEDLDHLFEMKELPESE